MQSLETFPGIYEATPQSLSLSWEKQDSDKDCDLSWFSYISQSLQLRANSCIHGDEKVCKGK